MVLGKTTLQQIQNETEQSSKLNTLLRRSFQSEQGYMHIEWIKVQNKGEDML